jgi:S-methylmethionine-dependent homocysteine/selenocysteine methylase
MARYRSALPQLRGDVFLTDGGIETTLMFKDGLELPCFAAFNLLTRPGGREALCPYFRGHAAVARDHGVGFILESATWRASPDWAAKLGYSTDQLAELNREAITLLEPIRAELDSRATPVVISGCVGPRGDGYDPGKVMTAQEAERYHAGQIGVSPGPPPT